MHFSLDFIQFLLIFSNIIHAQAQRKRERAQRRAAGKNGIKLEQGTNICIEDTSVGSVHARLGMRSLSSELDGAFLFAARLLAQRAARQPSAERVRVCVRGYVRASVCVDLEGTMRNDYGVQRTYFIVLWIERKHY